MGDILDGLQVEAYDRVYSDRELFSRILSYFGPKLPIVLFAAAMVVLDSLMGVALPILIAQSLDSLTSALPPERVLWLAGGILLFSGLGWLSNLFRQWYSARAIGDVVLTVWQDVFQAVLEQDLSFYDEHPSGKIVNRVTSDTQGIATVVTLMMDLLSQSMLIIFMTFALLSINIRLTLLTLAMAPVIVLVALSFRQTARHAVQQLRRAMASINAQAQESMSGIIVVKRFRQEQALYNEFTQVNKQAYRASLRQGLVYSGIFPVLRAVASMGAVIMVYLGGIDVLDSNLSPGSWFLFVQSISLFWYPLTSLSSFWSQFQQALAASERVFALLDAQPRVVQTAQEPAPRLAGRIEFKDLNFRYTDQEMVLQNFNLTIHAGEIVALVGHTGAGKSSLGRLIARLYEFEGGQLLIDGHDIRSFDLHEYRSQLGIVPQSPILFSGTVASNIRYARPQATDEQVVAAARQLGGDWLEALPQGLETPVGELGKGISMGQRQLVALSRVLLQDPAIVILDEATASVDPLTEAQIREGLDIALKGRTAIIIAHRLSTIKKADLIIALRQGQMIEQGDHDTLIRKRGYYAELYDAYFRHQSLDYEPEEKFTSAFSLSARVASEPQ